LNTNVPVFPVEFSIVFGRRVVSTMNLIKLAGAQRWDETLFNACDVSLETA
jgi:hypothetical protein